VRQVYILFACGILWGVAGTLGASYYAAAGNQAGQSAYELAGDQMGASTSVVAEIVGIIFLFATIIEALAQMHQKWQVTPVPTRPVQSVGLSKKFLILGGTLAWFGIGAISAFAMNVEFTSQGLPMVGIVLVLAGAFALLEGLAWSPAGAGWARREAFAVGHLIFLAALFAATALGSGAGWVGDTPEVLGDFAALVTSLAVGFGVIGSWTLVLMFRAAGSAEFHGAGGTSGETAWDLPT